MQKYVCEYVYVAEKAKSMQRRLKKLVNFNKHPEASVLTTCLTEIYSPKTVPAKDEGFYYCF